MKHLFAAAWLLMAAPAVLAQQQQQQAPIRIGELNSYKSQPAFL
jgi:hypothetical protein